MGIALTNKVQLSLENACTEIELFEDAILRFVCFENEIFKCMSILIAASLILVISSQLNTKLLFNYFQLTSYD